MQEAIEYIVFVAVFICLLMAVGSVPLAVREPAPRSSVAFGLSFALMAAAWIVALWRAGNETATLIVLQNALFCISLVSMFVATWLRAGYPADRVFIALLIVVWMLPNVVFSFFIPNVTIRFGAATLSMLIGIGSCIWRLAHKKTPKNSGDLLLMAWFAVSLLAVVYIGVFGGRDMESGSAGDLIMYLTAVPILFVGLGLFLYQSYTLDAIDEMERQARTDTLTGLMNRRAFDEELTRALARARRYGRPLSMVIADIDNFKKVNDRFGHPFGDRVLRDFAHMLREESREVDAVARIGGEEFAIVMPEIDTAQAAVFAERLRQSTEELVIRDVGLTTSIGVSSTSHSDYSGTALIQDADSALYQAKQNGRNRVELSGVMSVTTQAGREAAVS